MKQGTSTITTVFTNEVDGFKYEYSANHQPGGSPSYISFTVFFGSTNVVGGNKRTQNNTFTFEVYSSVTDEERNAIYNQVATDLMQVVELSSKINITTTE